MNNDDNIEEEAAGGGAADACSVCSADVGLSNDLPCPTCGLPLRNLISRGEVEETGECEDEDSQQAENQSMKDADDRQSNERTKKRPSESKTTPRKHALKPGVVHYRSVRRAVREEMIARIPGFNRARARSVVARFPDATFSNIAGTPVHVLSGIQVGKMNLGLGDELAKALKRVIS